MNPIYTGMVWKGRPTTTTNYEARLGRETTYAAGSHIAHRDASARFILGSHGVNVRPRCSASAGRTAHAAAGQRCWAFLSQWGMPQQCPLGTAGLTAREQRGFTDAGRL